MEVQTTHKAIVGTVTEMIGATCNRPYQKIRLAIQCDGEDPDELVTVLTDYNSTYQRGDVVQVSRWRKGNLTSYKIVKE